MLLLVVGVLAAVVVCAVAVVAVGTSQALKHSARQSEDQEQPQGDPLIDMETREQLLRQVRVHPLPIVILVQAQGVYTRFRLLDQYTHSCLSINKHTDC